MPRPDGPQFKFFHGTTSRLEPGSELLPPSKRPPRIKKTFPNETHDDFAYATEDEDTAWEWAEMAWHANTKGIPRVFAVEPLGDIEQDPTHDERGISRGVFSTDKRSRAGWRVLAERPMPEHRGDPEDWQ